MTTLTGTRDLPALRTAAKARVDAAAERARLRIVTPGSGQAAVYILKLNEAQRFVAEAPEAPEPAEWPMLAAEIGVTGDTLAEVAGVIVATAAAWKQAAAAIETIRLAAKAEIDTATNPAAMAAIEHAVIYPEPQNG